MPAGDVLGHEVVLGLLRDGLIRAEDVTGGGLVLRERSRRNRSVLVERRGGASHFVKWATGPSGARAIAREAAHLGRLRAAGLRDLVPGVLAADDERLVAEGFPNAMDLRDLNDRERGVRPAVSALLGDALGRLHAATALPPGAATEAEPPWALTLHRVVADDLRILTPAGIELVRMIQGDEELTGHLAGLRATWAPRAMTHNDLKWDNVLVLPPREAPSLRLVDWEHGGDGDPLWDVGSAVAAHLSLWVFSIEGAYGVPPEALPRLARQPLEDVAPAIAALWSAYLARVGLDDRDGALAADAVRWAAGRLVLTAYEASQGGGALGPHAVLHVQLAANLLARPREAMPVLGLAAPAVR